VLRPFAPVPLALALMLVAGCATVPLPEPLPTPMRGEGYVIPEPPVADAAAALTDLEDFTFAYGERHNNLPTHEGARQWLQSTMASYGLDTWRQNFTTNDLDQANIVGIKWGALRNEIVVVGAHYDTTHWDCLDSSMPCAGHKTSHGAYDDGSGTILTVHLAKAFANVSTFDSVAFVLYDGEERGLEGASAFAEALVDGTTPFGNVTVRAVLDLDMWGIMWPGTNAPTLALDNSEPMFALFDAARKEIGMPDDMVYRRDALSLGSSDYAVFMDQGIPTLFLTSDFGQFAAPGPTVHLPGYGIYPFWHFQDTYASMLAAAGGPTALEQGFQSALVLGIAVLHDIADDPYVVLEEE